MNGIALYEKPKSHVVNAQICCISFLHTALDIYLNKNTRLSKIQCNKETFQNFPIFFSKPSYKLVFNNVIFPEQGLCSLIFKNCLSSQIKFGVIVNSLLMKNRLSFIKSENIQSNDILPNLRVLLFEMAYGSLTFDLLDTQLFHKVKVLSVTRNLLEIETYLLREFKFLEFLEINILNLEEFFHRGSNTLSK